nr:MAG TPA: hypothetical protein [Caudoviricetes sp.]
MIGFAVSDGLTSRRCLLRRSVRRGAGWRAALRGLLGGKAGRRGFGFVRFALR